MKAAELLVPNWQAERDLPVSDSVRIADTAPVMRAAGNVVELAPTVWGFSLFSKCGPVSNFRSEGRDFSASNRCLIPASAFFEFSGAKSPKAKHSFTINDAPFMGIAGLWRPGQGNQPPTFTVLTTRPGADVQPYHHRQIVGLRPADWGAWLYLTKSEAELLAPLPAGSPAVENVQKSHVK